MYLIRLEAPKDDKEIKNPVKSAVEYEGLTALTVIMCDTSFEEALSINNIKEAVEKENKENEDAAKELGSDIQIESIDYKKIGDPLKISQTIMNIEIEDSEYTPTYIRNNPYLKKYHLTFETHIPINQEYCNKLYERYKEFDNIYLNIDGNSFSVSLKDYKYTVDTLTKYGNFIKSYSLSPIEQIMLAYDITRNRVYEVEGKGELFTLSRDLTEVIKGDKIVCAGFHQIFSNILENCGIKSSPYYTQLSTGPERHVRTKVRVDDDKYNIYGDYYFDPTWNCKKSEEDTKFINNYSHFALTKDKMDGIDTKLNLVEEKGLSKEIIDEINHFFETKNLKDVNLDTLITVKRLIRDKSERGPWDMLNAYKLMGVDPITGKHPDRDYGPTYPPLDFDVLKEQFNSLINTNLTPKLSYKTLIDIFSVVRNIEHSVYPDLFTFTDEDARRFANSRIEGYKYQQQNAEAKLLFEIFGGGFDVDPSTAMIDDYIESKKLPSNNNFGIFDNDYQALDPGVIKK